MDLTKPIFLVWKDDELVLSQSFALGRTVRNFWLGNRFVEHATIVTHSAESYFDDATIVSLKDLDEVLRRVHNRLVHEGYVIQGGKIYAPAEPML